MASQFIVGLLLLVAAIGVGCSSRATPIATVAAPTATHSPIATPAIDERSPTPILSPGPATSVGLDEMAFEYVSELSGLGPRESGTEQEAAAARYLASQFSAMGYSSKLQPFNVERFSVDQSGLALTGPESSTIEAVPLAGSAAGQANGVIVPLGLATASDFSKGGLEGKIALVRRGQITFQSKVDRAAEAGAAGVVIYNNRRGSFRGALPSSSMIPVMSISREDGARIEGLVSESGVEATMSIVTETHMTQNVVAESPGTRPDLGIVVFGAHYDTVPNVIGANDNASGTAVLLTLARRLSADALPFDMRFVAFGSEELGLRGSRFYVDSLSCDDQRRVIAMMNFDAVGSGSRVEVLGTTELTDLVVEEGIERGIDVKQSAGLEEGGSDHESFASIGVPVIFFFSEDFSRIHTPSDTLARINSSVLGDAARLALDLTDRIAATLENPDLASILPHDRPDPCS